MDMPRVTNRSLLLQVEFITNLAANPQSFRSFLLAFLLPPPKTQKKKKKEPLEGKKSQIFGAFFPFPLIFYDQIVNLHRLTNISLDLSLLYIPPNCRGKFSCHFI